MTQVNVGILSRNDARRGLWRDAECLLWALEEPPVRRTGLRPASVSLFAVDDYRTLYHEPITARAVATQVPCPAAVPPGTHFQEWLRRLQVMIVCETFLPAAFTLARRQGVRVVFVPNLDWAHLHGDSSRWALAVRKSGCEVWAKTAQIAAQLRACGLTCELVPWSIPDPVVREREARDTDDVTFLVNAGMGGWRNRRGGDLAVKAFALAARRHDGIRLILKSIKPLRGYLSADELAQPRVEQIEGMVSREELAALHARADAVLYPSRWEGFGLSLLESLHAGVPVLATDGWPMNELVEHNHNGLLVPAREVGRVRLAPHWECSPNALAEQMVAFAADAGLRRRLTCPDPSELVARQHTFRLRVRQLLLQEPPARAVIGCRRASAGWRPSELYWADALRLHGYEVDIAYYESDKERLRQLLARPHEFVLVSKAPAAFLETIAGFTRQPIILWHHDACAPRKGWMQTVSQLVDLLCVPESDLEQRFPALGAPALTLMPGAKVDGDRGPGRRPAHLPPADTGPDVVFLGNASQLGGNRVPVLRQLAQHVGVHIYGRGWSHGEWRTHPPVWSQAAAAVNRRARVVLSISYSAVTPHYTSNRLFNSCGAGACVVAEGYPGMDDHYPPQAVARFATPAECVDVVRGLLDDHDTRTRMRALAADHTWRNHTWADRVCTLLETVRTLPAVRAAGRKARHDWEARAARLGARAVGYYRWSDERLCLETERLWNCLWPHLASHGGDVGRDLIDFGCGTGRFSIRLATQGYRVTGVDIARPLIKLAARAASPQIDLQIIEPGARLPFATGAFDVLWSTTVLQHVADELFPLTVRELQRVLRPGACILLCENTEARVGRYSNSGHVVFRTVHEYQEAFPGIEVVGELVVEGERHTLFAGRLRSPQQ